MAFYTKNMIFKVTLLLCVIYSTFGKNVKITDDEERPLKWPSKYSIEARKYYMTSGFIENFKYWRSGRSSRLEANDGAIIKIVKGKRISRAGGSEYEIYPETRENEYNKIVCVKKQPSFVSPYDFLPEFTDLEREGNDHVKGLNCVKFTNAEESDKVYEKTLWAYYTNTSTGGWIPVRYKTKKIDTWHGYLIEYEIWDFFNFNNDVDADVFSVKYNCTTAKDDDDKLHTKSNANFKHDKVVSTCHSSVKQLSSRHLEDIKTNRRQQTKPKETGTIPFPYTKGQVRKIAETLPKEYDLRLEGLVGPVLNKETCESAWAIAATAVVEGAVARANGGSWMKFSEQALLDCSWGFGNKGCKGGTDRDSYEWIKKYGLPTEQDYGRYANNHGFCKIKNMTTTYKIKGITNVTPLSVDSLKTALVNHGPVSVIVDPIAEMLYDGGIFYYPQCNSSPSDSTVMTLVGYGEKDGDTFWILKNARGPYWGTDGYLHISARDNNCGVMTRPMYVVV